MELNTMSYFSLMSLWILFENDDAIIMNFNNNEEIKYIQQIKDFDNVLELNALMYKYREILPEIKNKVALNI
jgi:hypothetical protein